ncbi:MAG: mechanosensitive ion channel domain-containing protein [Halioglobus sp.]
MREELEPILGQLANYGGLITSVLLVMIGGMLAVFLLYKLMHSLIKPGGTYARAMAVFFGALYVLILVITVLVAAQEIDLPVEGLGGIAILIVIVGAVVVFFLLPFLPRLPFVTGDMVQIRNDMGIVETMTAYQIVLRTFDGQKVFIPTPVAMTSAIRNFSSTPTRRIQLDVDIYARNDIEQARAVLLDTMNSYEDVLADPEPTVFVTGVTGEKASIVGHCWVENANWFSTRDAIWVALASAFANDERVHLALPQLEISDR